MQAVRRLGDDARRRVLAADDKVGALMRESPGSPFPSAVAWVCPDCLMFAEKAEIEDRRED
jgi:hypothetical protein